MSKHDQRTRKYCKDRGLLIDKVEQYNFFSGRKNDLFGIFDYLAIDNNKTIGVQSCGADIAAHFVTLLVDQRENTKIWLSNPNRQILLIGWRKLRGKRAFQPRIFWGKLENGKLTLEGE